MRAHCRHHSAVNRAASRIKNRRLSNFVSRRFTRKAISLSESVLIRRASICYQEQWTQEKARDWAFRLPNSRSRNDVIGHPFMISRTIKGTKRLIIRTGYKSYARWALRRAHQPDPTSGFGNSFDGSSNQLSRNETSRNFSTRNANRIASQILEKQKMLTATQIKKLRGIFKEAVKSNPSPRLNQATFV